MRDPAGGGRGAAWRRFFEGQGIHAAGLGLLLAALMPIARLDKK
jgi:hypothetical protein